MAPDRAQPALPTSEPSWPSAVAVLVAMLLYLSLPGKIMAGHYGDLIRFLAPALELVGGREQEALERLRASRRSEAARVQPRRDRG